MLPFLGGKASGWLVSSSPKEDNDLEAQKLKEADKLLCPRAWGNGIEENPEGLQRKLQIYIKEKLMKEYN